MWRVIKHSAQTTSWSQHKYMIEDRNVREMWKRNSNSTYASMTMLNEGTEP